MNSYAIFFLNSWENRQIMNKTIYYLSFLLSLFSATTINAQPILKFKNSNVATIGIYIQDLKNGHVVYQKNSSVAMTPASVTKSITVAGAMLTTNKQFRYETEAYLIGDTTKYNDSINANIVIVSSGDPTLESEHFPHNNGFIQQITNKLKTLGVKFINGNIAIQEKRKIEDYTSSWMLEDIAWDYGAGYRGFNYKDNKFKFEYYPDSAKVITDLTIPGIKFDINVSPNDNNSNIILSRGFDSKNLSITGTYKIRSHPKIKAYCSQPNSCEVFINELNTSLAQNNIYITQVNSKFTLNDTLLLYTHFSPKRNDIMRSLMVRSDNLFADAIMQSIAQLGAIDSLITTFNKKGLNCSCISLYDGCGLSRIDRLTPKFIAEVYKLMYNSPHKDDYIATFPIAGKDGTLANFCKGSKLEGKLAMKTGSMSGVQCYGGYKLNDENEPTHSVVIMVNNFFCERYLLRKAIQNFLLEIF